MVGINSSWSSHQDNPFIVNLLIKLATVFMNNQARAKVKTSSLTLPHLVHNIFCGFQDILGAFGRILMETPSVLHVRTNENIDDSLYVGPHRVFSDNIKKFSNFVELSQHGDFFVPLPSYETFHGKPTKPTPENVKHDIQGKGKKRSDKGQGRDSNGKDGNPSDVEQGNWLTAAAGVTISQHWKLDGFQFCRNHAFTNLTCKNPQCKYDHFKWGKIPADKKVLVKSYVDASDNKFRLAK
jgi:hypothetical protein